MAQVQRQDIHNSDVPLLCIACEARHKGVCGALTPLQLTELSRHTKRHAIAPGGEMFAAGAGAGRHSNILSGVVKLSKLLPDGRQQIVGLQFAPDFLGRQNGPENTVTAEAATNVRLCSFPQSALEAVVAQSPETGHRLHLQTLRELDEARDWMITLGRKTAAEKLASFICLVASHHNPEKTPGKGVFRFELPLKRADIADFLGLTIETVSRHFTKLRKSGIIFVENNRQITINDMDRLLAASQGST